MDRVSKEKRSIIMSQVHGTETSPEIKVRKSLFSQGFRYRKNDRRLPGTPDIVLKKYNTAIFINGCFWHHHKNCRYASIPQTNTEFWIKKFNRNVMNDRKHTAALRKMGYHVITIWECSLKKDYEKEMRRVIRVLTKNDSTCIGKKNND